MVLGLANRTVADAQHYAEGFGYVVVGLQPGDVLGTDQLDAADVDGRLSKYLGDQGLGWGVNYHPVEGCIVMLIEVRPPRSGDPIFTLRKGFQPDDRRGTGSDAGAIFVRARTATGRATPDQLDALQRRLTDGVKGPDAEIDVAAIGSAVRLVNIEGFRQACIAEERDRLLDPLPRYVPEPSDDFSWLDRAASMHDQSISSLALGDLTRFLGATSTSAAGLAAAAAPFGKLGAASSAFEVPWQASTILDNTAYEEERDEDEYRTSVDDYLAELDAYSFERELKRALVDQRLAKPRFEVRNLAEMNLEELDIDVFLPGDVNGFDESHAQSEDHPRPPRLWGDAPRGHISRSAAALADMSRFVPTQIAPRDDRPGPTKPSFRNSGSVDLNYFIEHMRPMESSRIIRGNALVEVSDNRSEIAGTWRATAKNVNKVFSGTVVVPILEIDATSLLEQDDN